MATSMRSTLANWGRKAKFERLESRRMLDGDQFEPNDSFAAATDLGTAGVIVESGLSIHAAENDDYYQFTAGAAGSIDISIYFSHAAGDLDMEVYDVNEVLVDYSESETDDEFVTISALQGEVFYVMVYGYNGATNPDYDLEITGSVGGTPDFYEANDDFASAYVLGSLGSFYDSSLSIHEAFNDDYFQFSPLYSGNINVSVYFQNSQGDIDLEVYDNNLLLIDTSESTEDFESVLFGGVQGETYYIKVVGFGGATNPDYDLEVITPVADPDFYEVNDTFEEAYNLGGLGDFSDTGLSIHESGNDDYFQFLAAASGDYAVSIFFEHDLGDVDLEIFDSAQTLIDSSTGTIDSEFALFSAVQGETYFVRVFGYDGATNPDYELVIDGPALPPDIYEPNDSFAAAYELGSLGNFSASDLSIHEGANDDYFRFTAATTGDVNVSILFEHDYGDVDLAVYDSLENFINSSTSTGDSEQVVFSAIQGQTYYIHIYGYSGAINPDYDLSIVSTPDDGLLGDYNTDSVVNAADYALWRDTLGSTTNLAANGDDSNNVIDEDDYDVWVENFGLELPVMIGSATGAMPTSEPANSSAISVSTYAPTGTGEVGTAALERLTKSTTRAVSPSSQARILALLDLLDSLPDSESDSIPSGWDVAEEAEFESAAREEVFSSYFAAAVI